MCAICYIAFMKMILIISDWIADAALIYEKTVAEGLWDKVIIFHAKKSSNVFKFFGLENLLRIVIIKFQVEKLIRQEKIENICIFTVGDPTAKFFAASKLTAKTYLCEDGTYPY